MTPEDPASGPPSGRVAQAPEPGEAGPVCPPAGPAGNTEDREYPHPAEVSLPGPLRTSAVPGETSPPLRRSVPRGVAAGIPSPVTGAARLDRDAAPGRGRKQAPAGAGLDADGAALAGSTGRTFTIALPPGLKLLSLNDRLHWSTRYRRSQALKKAAWVLAVQAKIPRLERISVVAEYQPSTIRRRRDAENTCAPSAKACLDGIVAAGVLEDDECPRYVTEITCTVGEPHPGGRLVLYLTEVAAATGGEAA